MIKDMADDEAIQATNDDASECKRYAVQLGYWCDPFIGLFVKQTARKAPEINRGYYARVKGIELFVDKFLKVSVGALRIASSSPLPSRSLRFFLAFVPLFCSRLFREGRATARGRRFPIVQTRRTLEKSLVPIGCTFCTLRGSSLSSRCAPTLVVRSFRSDCFLRSAFSMYVRSVAHKKTPSVMDLLQQKEQESAGGMNEPAAGIT